MAGQPLYIVKGYVDTDHGQIHYRRCGLGVPSVLMLHASPGSSIMFVSALKRLAARGLHAVALDLPNCGESCRTAEEPKVADLADAVLQAAQALRFSASIDLIGHQGGAVVAAYIASELPSAVRRLVLWGVPVLGFMERGDAMREEAPDYENDLPGVVQDYIERRYPTPVPWQLKVRSLIDMLQMYERRPWTTKATAAVDLNAILKTLEMPVLFMAGDGEPYQKHTMKAALLCQNGKYVNLGPAGSDVVDEVPDEYVRELYDFLSGGGPPLERSSMSTAAEQQGGDSEGRNHLSEGGRRNSAQSAAAAVPPSGGGGAMHPGVVHPGVVHPGVVHPGVVPGGHVHGHGHAGDPLGASPAKVGGRGTSSMSEKGTPPKGRGSTDSLSESRRSSGDSKKKLLSLFKK